MTIQDLTNEVLSKKTPVMYLTGNLIDIFKLPLPPTQQHQGLQEAINNWAKQNNFEVHYNSVYNYYVFLRNETAT